uniref:Beta-1,4-mannosyl-glycoprotein 4-beta-N-acetylglucosaminyltransferase n=1 Tax=Arcella intermedia TaxID=1963864 RepID=A0A6B2L7I6_9EUKA
MFFRLLIGLMVLNFVVFSFLSPSSPFYESIWLVFLNIRPWFRPLVDEPPEKWGTEFINRQSLDCSLYGWTNQSKPIKVYDAFLFSLELEWLEVRLNELEAVIDYFVIVESATDFMGKPKELVFQKNKDKFKKFEHKICYHAAEVPKNIKDKWEREDYQRHAVKDAVSNCFVEKGDIIIFGDLDELPRPDIVRLLRKCTGYPQPVNLALRNYLYSFEWEDVAYYPNPRLTVWIWNHSDPFFKHFPTHHDQIGDTLIHDAGWHCSWCFKYIEEFQWKMKAYSHSNEFWRPIQHDPNHIQQAICTGERLQGTYHIEFAINLFDVHQKIQLIKSVKSMVSLPQYVIDNQKQYSYLLPGGCKRESARN